MDPSASASQARFIVPAVLHQLPAPGRHTDSTALYIAIAHGPADYVVAHAGVIAERYLQAGVAFAALGEAILPRGSQGPQVSGPSFLESVKTSSLAHHPAVSKLFSSKDASAFDCVVAAVLKRVLARPSLHERPDGPAPQPGLAAIDPTEEASVEALLKHGLGWLLRDEVRPAGCPSSPPPFRFTSSSASASLFVPLPQRKLALPQAHAHSAIGIEPQGMEADGLWPGDIVLKAAGGHTAGCSPALLQAYIGILASQQTSTHSTQGQAGSGPGTGGSGEQAGRQQAQAAIKFRVARPVELHSSSSSSSSRAAAARADVPALQPHRLPHTTTSRTTSTRQPHSGTPAGAASPRSPSSPTSPLPSRRSPGKGTLPVVVSVERQRSGEEQGQGVDAGIAGGKQEGQEKEQEEGEPQSVRAASGRVVGSEGQRQQQTAVDSTPVPHAQPQEGAGVGVAPAAPVVVPAAPVVVPAAPVAVPAVGVVPAPVAMQKNLALLKRKTGTGGTPGRRASVGGSTRSAPLVSPPPAPYYHPVPRPTGTPASGRRGQGSSPLGSRSVDLASLPASTTTAPALALGEGLDARARVMARQRLAEERMRARSASVGPVGSRGRGRAHSLSGGIGTGIGPASLYGSGVVFSSPSPTVSLRPTTPSTSTAASVASSTPAGGLRRGAFSAARAARPLSSSSSSRSRQGPGGAPGSVIVSRPLLPHQRRPSTFALGGALGGSPALPTAPPAPPAAAAPAAPAVQATQRPVKRSASAQPRVASSGGMEVRRPSVGSATSTTSAAGKGSIQRPSTATTAAAAAVRPGAGGGVGVSQTRRIGTRSVLQRSSSVPPPATAPRGSVTQPPGAHPHVMRPPQQQRGQTSAVGRRPPGPGKGPVGVGGPVRPRSSPAPAPVASPVYGTSPASPPPAPAIRIPPGFRSPTSAGQAAVGVGAGPLGGTPLQGQGKGRTAPRVTIGASPVPVPVPAPSAHVNVYADLVSPPPVTAGGGRGRARAPDGPPAGYRASELQELEVIEAELAAQGY